MSIFSRRKDDPRPVWDGPNTASTTHERADDAGLAIPPCVMASDADERGSAAAPHNNETAQTPPAALAQTTAHLAASAEASSQCWAFMGAIGGAGTTTLAVQLAFELAKSQAAKTSAHGRNAAPKVCVIDLDFEASGLVHHLDIQPGLSHDDLSGDPARIDDIYVRSLLSEHSSGISVLAAPNRIDAHMAVNPMTVLALLDAVCDLFPYVILDMPRYAQPWTQPALMGADFFGLVTELTIPSLHMTRLKNNQIDSWLAGQTPSTLIMNKFERRAFKNTLRLSDAEGALKTDIFASLCNDPDAARDASNCGVPVGHIKPDSRYAKDCRKLLSRIQDSMAATPQNTSNSSILAV